jgi:hypothetical protein
MISCEHGTESLNFIKVEDFLDKIGYCQLHEGFCSVEFDVILKISLMICLKVVTKYYIAGTEENHDEH